MAKEQILLTKEGYDKLMQELDLLKGQKRRQIARDILEAREHGDLSENAEYHAAKEAQALNEKRIAQIENILTNAKIIDASAMDRDTALIGAIVRIYDMDSREEFEYLLVSAEESDFDMNKISVTSPVGKALMGHKVGDEIEINVPVGKLRYKIVNVRRED